MISVMPRILKDDPTAQEFVNELNIAEDYKEPAKRKYNERSFYFNAFCRLFFCSIIRHVVFPFGLRKRRKEWEMRKAAGMSQEQLAEILCTKKATISAYENDHIDIKSGIVLEIAKALNCSGSYLLEGKKAEALDARIMDALLELKNDQMREVALKQIQALALLG